MCGRADYLWLQVVSAALVIKYILIARRNMIWTFQWKWNINFFQLLQIWILTIGFLLNLQIKIFHVKRNGLLKKWWNLCLLLRVNPFKMSYWNTLILTTLPLPILLLISAEGRYCQKLLNSFFMNLPILYNIFAHAEEKGMRFLIFWVFFESCLNQSRKIWDLWIKLRKLKSNSRCPFHM